MKTICALLLVGIVAYVSADDHECDPFAANIRQKTGHDKDDLVLPLEAFLQAKKSVFLVTAATPSQVPDSSEFCTAPTHGANCQAVGYYRELIGDIQANTQNGVKDVEFSTTFVGVRGDGYAVQYEMTIGGVDDDDYIFQYRAGTELTATQHAKSGDSIPVPIPKSIADILKSEFALYYTVANGFSLYITCDGKYMWVSYSKAAVDNNTMASFKSKLDEEVNKLKALALKHRKVEPTLKDVPTTIPESYRRLIPTFA